MIPEYSSRTFYWHTGGYRLHAPITGVIGGSRLRQIARDVGRSAGSLLIGAVH